VEVLEIRKTEKRVPKNRMNRANLNMNTMEPDDNILLSLYQSGTMYSYYFLPSIDALSSLNVFVVLYRIHMIPNLYILMDDSSIWRTRPSIRIRSQKVDR